MSEQKHTPGPWEVRQHTGSDGELGPNDDWSIYGPGDKWICHEGGYNENVQADAHLIAAAPEMYALLYELFIDGPVSVALAGNPKASAEFMDRVTAMFAKAEGK